MNRFLAVVELTSVAVGAIHLSIKVFTFFSPIVRMDMVFLLELMLSMSKRAF